MPSYTKPALIDLGSFAELTQQKVGSYQQGWLDYQEKLKKLKEQGYLLD